MNTKKTFLWNIRLFVVLLMWWGTGKAQVTTSAINGRVSDHGEALPGAAVVAVHVPSGTVYTGITNNKGYFILQGMRSGAVSYTYENDVNNDGINYDLLYIPASQDELHFKDYTLNAGRSEEMICTAAQQQQAFWNLVNQDPYLKKRKGKYARAYDAYLPWVHRFNLRFVQDVHIELRKTSNKIQFSVDLLNIGNLLNNKWGLEQKIWRNGRLLSYQGKNSENQPLYHLLTITDQEVTKLPTETSYKARTAEQCWALQLGVRYVFN